MKVAFVLSTWAMFKPLDPIHALTDKRGMTGSETGCISYARAFAKMGHDVVVRGLFTQTCSQDGVRYEMAEAIERDGDYDLVIAWTDPRPLAAYKSAKRRVFHQQVNDFTYCPGWEQYTDVTISPSANHQDYIKQFTSFPLERWLVGYNGIDPDVYGLQGAAKAPRLIYASSPDRGLHHLLELFPRLKREVPSATLTVCYDWQPFYDRLKDQTGEMASRLRYCAEMFRRLKPHGVTHLGSISKAGLVQHMRDSRVLAYPCDPVSYTEGFSVTTAEAAALGCLPVILGSDALPEVYGAGMEISPAPYAEGKGAYFQHLVAMLTDDDAYVKARLRASDHVHEHYTWDVLAEKLLREITRAPQ